MTQDNSHIIPIKYWHKLDDGRMQCDLCPRSCTLRDGQPGLCFVRMRQGDEMVLITYGRSSGFCVDPIEKKPLFHFLPGTPILSFGTAGCNLTCQYCQNWDISKSREDHTLTDEASPQQIAQAAKKLDCRSVAFTYNDPVVFMEYAIDVAKACHEVGIKTVAVTAGYINLPPLAQFCQHLDAIKVDLKAFDDKFYQKLCSARLTPVLEVLEYIRKETKCWLELVTLIIPGENDSEKELQEMTQWIYGHLGANVPIHFTAFHPDWQMTGKASTPPQTLIRARAIALKNGLRYAYTGNMHNEEGESTYCHACGQKLIGRDWYEMTVWHLDDTGNCKFCKTPCAGVFEKTPGRWGAKRLPVRLKDFSNR